MEHFVTFMTMIIDFMKTPINLWGFETSYWGSFLFVMLGSFVFWFIGSIFNG